MKKFVLVKIGILISCLFAGMRFIRQRLTAMQEETFTPDQAAAEPEDDDDFFARRRNDLTELTQLDEYLLSRSTETVSVAAWPLMKRLFFETNTALPASAA